MTGKTSLPRGIWVLLLLLCLLAGVALLSLCTGSAGIPIQRIFWILLHGKDTPSYAILMDIRMPRILAGLTIGGALGLSGAILQGIFRNPLVEPYTLGISGGASLGVCLTIVGKLQTSLGVLALPASGLSGSLCVILLLYGLSLRKGALENHRMLLTGVMLSFVASSLVMLLLALSKTEELHGIIFWVMGSLDESNALLLHLSLWSSLLGLVVACLFSLDLNAMALGEEEALHLGVDVNRTKKVLFLLASLLTGISVSVAGIIGFVGLVVPHFVRIAVGSDHRLLIPCSFLAGASFLTLCDTLARTLIAPLELPVGVITGILGGGLFVYALSRKRVSL